MGMNIFIKSTDLELTEPLKTYINEKINALNKLFTHLDPDTVKVQIEVARTSNHHRQGDVYRAEANMSLPHEVLRAEEENSDIRAAVDVVKDKLKREIESYLSRHGKDHREGHSIEK